jgi:hypothetical protein
MYSSCRGGTPVPRLASGHLIVTSDTPTPNCLPAASSTPPTLLDLRTIDHAAAAAATSYTSPSTTGRCSAPPSLERICLSFLLFLPPTTLPTDRDPRTWNEKPNNLKATPAACLDTQASYSRIDTIIANIPLLFTPTAQTHRLYPLPTPTTHVKAHSQHRLSFLLQPHLHLHLHPNPLPLYTHPTRPSSPACLSSRCSREFGVSSREEKRREDLSGALTCA